MIRTINRTDITDFGKRIFDEAVVDNDYLPSMEGDAIRWIIFLAKIVGGDFLEIGCRYGHTTATLASNLTDRLIYSCDWCSQSTRMVIQQCSEAPLWANVCEQARNLSNVIFINGDSAKLRLSDSIRCVLIDADHSYDGVKADTIGVMKWFKGGFIAWHDYSVIESWIGVRRFLTEFAPDLIQIDGTSMVFKVFGIKENAEFNKHIIS